MSYRILSLDGGGSWALLEVLALMSVFGDKTSGWEVLSQFDLAAGNSGGSIVLACLLEDLPLHQILDFFVDPATRDSVFQKTQKPLYWLARWTGIVPKYSTEDKLPALQKALPKMADVCLDGITDGLKGHSGKPVHILITSFDYDRNRATFFRSHTVADVSWGTGAVATVTLAEAVHASANPPVEYFDAPAIFSNHSSRYWDGGVAGCNNPVLASVAEAIGILTNGQKYAPPIIALSLGSGAVVRPPRPVGQPPSPLFAERSQVSWRGDLEKLAESILDDPPDIASFLAHLMTGSGNDLDASLSSGLKIDSRIVRMSPLVSPVPAASGAWTTPGGMRMEDFEFLTQLSLDAIAPGEVQAILDYASMWLKDLAPNQPVRLDSTTLKPELGQGRLSQALEAWLTLSSL